MLNTDSVTSTEAVSERAMQHLNVLVGEIGERPLGSAAHRRAEKYVRETFTAAGYTVEEQAYPCPDWTCSAASLTLNGAPLAIEANPYSPACTITAPTVAVGTLRQLEHADLNGKIAVLYGDLARSWVFPIGFVIYNPERDQAINRLLIKKAPLAVLAIKPKPGHRMHIFEDWDLPLPSATVETADGITLLQHAGEPVALELATTSTPAEGHTFIATQIPGAAKPRLLVMAHHDTKFGTPGAFDNGAGMAVVLALAEAYAGRDLPVALEFIAWGDEEYGGQSDGVYIKAAGESLDNILLAINYDSVGHIAGTNNVVPMANSSALEDTVQELLEDFPGMEMAEPWYASNHSTFAMRGVPAVVFGATLPDLTHQPLDRLDAITPEKVAEAIAYTERLITAVQDQPLAWTRPE